MTSVGHCDALSVRNRYHSHAKIALLSSCSSTFPTFRCDYTKIWVKSGLEVYVCVCNFLLTRLILKILRVLESWGPVLFISARNLNFHLRIKNTGTNVNLQPGFYSDIGTITPKGWKSTGTWAQERSFSVTVVPVSNAQSITMSYRGHSVTTISS